VRRPLTIGRLLKNPLVIIFIILLIGTLIFVAVSPGINLQASFGDILSGSTIMSMDRMEYQSSNPIFGRSAWNIQTRVDGSGQYASGVFTPAFIQEHFGLLITEPFTIKQSIPSMECEYQITNTTYDLYSWGTATTRHSVACGASYPSVGASCENGGTITTSSSGTPQSACDSYWICTYPTRGAKVGAVHLIDSSTTFFVTVNTTLEIGEQSHSILTTSQQQEGQIPGVMYVRSTGFLSGYRTCPVPATDYSGWRLANTNNIVLKPKYILQNAITKCSSVASLSSATECNAAIAQIAPAAPADFYACGNAVINGTSTKMRCTPKYQVVIPETQIVIPEGVITAVVPVARPEIINVSFASELAAAGNVPVTVRVKNNANISGPVDLVVLGGTDIQTVSQRININAGETKSIELLVQGAGLIKRFTVVATSVNDPSINDTETIKLKFLPFCDKTKPSPRHVLVYTQYGCEWVCPNQYINPESETPTNIFEQDCSNIDYVQMREDMFDEIVDGITLHRNPYRDSAIDRFGTEAKHCVGDKQYTYLEDYLDAQRVFAPEDKIADHLVWLASPVCRYVAEYGYVLDAFGNAQEINEDYEFYAYSVPTGRLVEAGSTGGTTGVLPSPSEIPMTVLFVIGGLVIFIFGLVAYIFVKKRR